MRELEAGAREKLRCEQAAPEWRAGAKGEPMPAEELRSLHTYLQTIPGFRKKRGQRYDIACYMTIMIAARLSGYRGIAAFGEYAARLDEEQLRAVGGFWSPSRRRFTAPATSTFHCVLSSMPPDALETALREWIEQFSEAGAPVALDGKDVRGASRQIEGERRMLVAAVEHGSGLVLGQVRVGSKTNEIPAVRQLSQDLDLKGQAVALDALHAQQETARCLVESCRADYVAASVKDNQPTIRKNLEDLDWAGANWSEDKFDKGHGRLETRRCAVFDLSDPKWKETRKLKGRKQAFRIERTRHVRKSGKTSRETVYGLTSLGADKAGPDAMLSLVSNHWHIENRLHFATDFTCDEDRCRARVRHLPRNLACLSNAAISIIRLRGEFKFLPEANRRYAAKTQDALDAVLNASRRQPLPGRRPQSGTRRTYPFLPEAGLRRPNPVGLSPLFGSRR